MCTRRRYTYNVHCVQFILTVHISLMCIHILLCPVFLTVHTTMNCIQYLLRPVYPNGKNSADLHGTFSVSYVSSLYTHRWHVCNIHCDQFILTLRTSLILINSLLCSAYPNITHVADRHKVSLALTLADAVAFAWSCSRFVPFQFRPAMLNILWRHAVCAVVISCSTLPGFQSGESTGNRSDAAFSYKSSVFDLRHICSANVEFRVSLSKALE